MSKMSDLAYTLSDLKHQLENADVFEVDEELLHDTIEAMEGTFAEKVEYLLKRSNEALVFARVCAEEEKRLAERRKMLEKRANRIKDYIKHQMLISQINKFEFATFTTYLQNDPPKVVVSDESLIPNEWWREKVEREVDKKSIIEHYKATKQAVPGIQVEQGVSLRIK